MASGVPGLGEGAPVLLLAAHGSRDVRFAATARRVAVAATTALPGVRVELAYLDLNEPLLPDALDALTGDVTVVPLLFGDGYHSKTDLPEILDRAAARNPRLRPHQTPVIGVHSPVPALIDRLAEAGLRAPSTRDGVLMYAVGSSDAGSDASVRARGRELSRALGVPVETVFATRLGPDGAAVREAVARLRGAGASRIAASPLFLSAGLLTERVERVLDDVAPGSLVAGPIAAHPGLISAITELYRAAVPVPVA
ncbi:sirohydrochlorin chelatase [Gordonia sp. (in: high G+C Gram-positive bacteria)]|uniref:sirohydrochlorin chelatase n=1 Tax=unclassified Gordonia (in: high G+C Gram-positive bacteria) TaxID=2657482 RepID=UPI00261D88EF|nr:sirohydrochlorin chelatase [Gordonia sp. (in: high G+C Gram-positive bacteria)]